MKLTNKNVEDIARQCRPAIKAYRKQNRACACIDDTELESVLHQAIMVAAKSYDRKRGTLNNFVIARAKWFMQHRSSEYNDTPFNLTRSMFQGRLVLARRAKAYEKKHGEKPAAHDIVKTQRRAATAQQLINTMANNTVQFQDDIDETENNTGAVADVSCNPADVAEKKALMDDVMSLLGTCDKRERDCLVAYSDGKPAMLRVAKKHKISYVRVWQIANAAANNLRQLLNEN